MTRDLLSEGPRPTPYLTIIPRRTPKQKVHTALGHAKNAFDGYNHGDMYEMKDGEWVLLYHVEQPVRVPGSYRGTETRPWKMEEAAAKLAERERKRLAQKALELEPEYIEYLRLRQKFERSK